MKNALPYIPQKTIEETDVLILTETFLTEKTDITGFYNIHTYAQPTAGRPAGGVSCLVKGTMGKLEKTHKGKNLVIVKTTIATIICIYIPPGTTTENTTEIISHAIEQTRNDENVILAGDFNCRIDKPSIKTEILINTLEEEGLRLINKKEMPTYVAPNGTSVIDLVFYRGEKLTPII